MPSKSIILGLLLCLALLTRVSDAAFVVSVDSSDLRFTGPGTHEVDLFLSFLDSGIDRSPTLDGMQIDITNASNAVVRKGAVPSGITGQFLPAFNINDGNRFGWGGIGDVSIPSGQGVLLTTLTFDVADNQSFTIGLDFVEATRSFTTIDGGTLGDRSIVSVPTTFTVVSVPEPSSIAFLMAVGAVCVSGRRRRRAS